MGEEAPEYSIPQFRTTVSVTVDQTRYSNARVINNADKDVRDNEAVDKNVDSEAPIDNNDQYHGCHAVEVINKLKAIDTVTIDNNKRKLNCLSLNRLKRFFIVVFEACIDPRRTF